MKVKIFHYVPDVDAFVVTEEYAQIARALDLWEWSPVVWIGRLFALDNDYGEHWFDNWHARETRINSARRAGMSTEDLLVIDPDRFMDGKDGPCHSDAIRREFWHDVLDSLELSYSLLFAKARAENEDRRNGPDDDFIEDLEERIHAIATAAISDRAKERAPAMKDVMTNRPAIVTLCGSTRFYEAFRQAQYEETMAGRIVLTVGFLPGQVHGESVGCTREQKQKLDELHYHKIAMSDQILVLNVDGYVGESTRREIALAWLLLKQIRWLDERAANEWMLDTENAQQLAEDSHTHKRNGWKFVAKDDFQAVLPEDEIPMVIAERKRATAQRSQR